MRYVSTRGAGPVGFSEVLLSGTAPDGGLWLPERWPRLTPEVLESLAGRPYAEVAARIVGLFVEPDLDRDVLARLADEAYRSFDHPAVAPLRQLDADRWLLELHHGPTLAFKDLALQLLGRLIDHELSRRDRRVTIVAATSGDTGSAAIAAVAGLERVRIMVLHPAGRISDVQRRQMTTVDAPNVHNVAVEGTFDDCQDIVKALFADPGLAGELSLVAVNSINWARVAAQTVYWVTAAVALGAPARAVSVAVPTGNFGNVYAAHVARAMGVPLRRLIVATNANDTLTRLLSGARLETREVVPTLSPAMDISVPSNLERLLFELTGRDPERTTRIVTGLRETGSVGVPEIGALAGGWTAATVDDAATLATIRAVHDTTGALIDPHTAVGVAAARRVATPGEIVVVAATAHPAKFADAIREATGLEPPAPPRLAALTGLAERYVTLPPDPGAVADHLRAVAAG